MWFVFIATFQRNVISSNLEQVSLIELLETIIMTASTYLKDLYVSQTFGNLFGLHNNLPIADVCGRGMLHDPNVYTNPSEFMPERFLPNGLTSPQPDPRGVAFGFGRR